MDTMPDDEMVVAQFQAGRQDAFDELMRRYKHKIYGYILRSVKNYEDAEELTIEVFFKAYRALAKWRPQARFSTWLYKIAYNVSIDYHRARKRRMALINAVQIDDDEVYAGNEPASTDLESNPEECVIENDRHRLITIALEALSPKQKTVFIMSRYEGLQIREIAEVLGLAEGTVKIHLHRAVKKLQTQLRPLWEKNEI